MENPKQKFRQSSVVFGKPGILSENLKTLTSSNYTTVQYLFAKTSHTFPTYQCLQACLDFELFAKIKKDLVSTHLYFTLLLITQDLNGIKKKSRITFSRHY